MQLERVPNRGSFKLGRTQQIPDLNSRAHQTVASGLHAVPQKCSKRFMQLERAPHRSSFKLGSKNGSKKWHAARESD